MFYHIRCRWNQNFPLYLVVTQQRNFNNMWISAALLLISFVSPFQCGIEGWESLGCWRDLPARAIASLEGKSSLLGENWKKRANPLNACAEAAKEDNLKVFAVQDGGQCFGGPYAHVFYSQYGPSNLCKGGLGGVWSNSVYSSKTAYTRVLESKKENEKIVKCSKPLDMVFLVDGSGDDSVENKLRWDQMLKFVSKATEHFDSPSTRFGVILFGSQPKTVVNINDNKDQIAMRDSIISANFPGGPRTINEALKKAWKEQLKYTERGRNKVIVTLATGNMDYGPWGSSLFLTNRGVRLLSFGIDRAPSYRYLETISSGKHPENIYSIDSEQLDELLPYFAKDVCTGFKKSKIETVRKDNEIDLISTQDFETVGSVVERKSSKKENGISQVNLKNKNAIDSEIKNFKQKDSNNEKEEGANELNSKSEDKEDKILIGNKYRGRKTENISVRSDDVNKTLSIGSNENDDNKVNENKENKIFPVNNSSLSDGEIVEKLKESAVEVLKNAESAPLSTNFSTGEPLVKENPREMANAGKKVTTSSGQDSSSNNESLSNSGTGISANNNESLSNTEGMTITGKDGKYQSENSLGESYTADQSIDTRYSKRNSNKSRNTSISTLKNAMVENSLSDRAKSSGKINESARKPWISEASSQMLEGKNAEESHDQFSDDAKSEFTGTTSTVSNRNYSTRSSSIATSEESKNSTTSFKKYNSENHSSSEEHYNKDIGKDSEKDIDNEIFNKLQLQRESIGHEENENQDEGALSEVKSVKSLGKNKEEESSEDSFGKENIPDDEFSIDEDERATQNALEQKRREIDVLLKKLDETRRRRKRRKVRQGSKNFGNDDAVEDFEENENDANFRRKKERKNAENKDENGMETGLKRRLHDNILPNNLHGRHFLLITHNDSKPVPVKRPFKTVPTTKALRLLDKLYNFKNKPNMQLQYDIFDPTYSSADSKVMTKSTYKKMRHQIKQKPRRVHETGKIVSKSRSPNFESDKQQLFLRNGISSKDGYRRNSTGEVYRTRKHWRNENANKKYTIKSQQPKNLKKTNHFKPKTFDIKKALDKYYSYYIKHMQPLWHYGKRKSKMAYFDDNAFKKNQSLVEINRQKSKLNQNGDINKGRVVNQSNPNLRNIEINSKKNLNISKSDAKSFGIKLTSNQDKLENGASISFAKDIQSVNATSVDVKEMSFKSLKSIDSGNYTIFRFSKNEILINLQSKSGKLQTFYGGLSAKRKSNKMFSLASSPNLGAFRNHLKANGHQIKTAMKENNTRKVTAVPSTSTAIFDNLKYFQSSLKEEPGYARSFRNNKLRMKHQRQNVKNHAAPNPLQINSNLTAFDIYDNRLAHIERQRQYFKKDRSDPDRLVITENNDPFTDSSTVKLFVNAGDENSLMPLDSVGLSSHKEGKTKSLLSGVQDEFSEKGKWNSYIDTFMKDDGNTGNSMHKVTEKAIRNNGKQERSGEGSKLSAGIENATTRAESSVHGLKKIVEDVSNNNGKKSDAEGNQNDKEAAKQQHNERKGKKIETKNTETKIQHKNNISSTSKTNQINKDIKMQRLSQSSSNFETKPKYSDKKEGREANNEDVWVFKPDTTAAAAEENGREKTLKHNGSKVKNMKETGNGASNASLDSGAKGDGIQSISKEEMVSSEGSLLTKINEELGCTRPVAVLYALDVSDAIGTGPTRQRKWNHMKRFLRSVNDKVIHGGTMGYIVYDTEPRFLSNLEPCDEKTEYFITSGECLCDHSSAFFHKGKSSCSTHAPTEDESIEDWGKQGPRTAKALNFAEKVFANKSLGDSKKLVVLVTHEASTDDVTGAERSLKENSISLVDIEIGERHNINKRSNRFDDLIPRDHQMEVSFYKLDKAIENIFTKVCKEKDPTKTRRSRIFATLRKHKHWW